MSLALYSYIFLTAIRERIIPFVLITFALIAALSYVFGAAAFVEKQAFIIVFAGFGLRLACMVSLVLFSVFFVRRSFEMQEVAFFVSGALSRVQLVATYALALASIAVLVGLAAGVAVLAITAKMQLAGSLIWLGGMIGENIIIVIVSLFFAVSLRSAPQAIFAVSGFYLLARINGHLLGIIDSGTAGSNPVITFSGKVVEFVLALMPRLDLVGQGSWLLYGAENISELALIILQAFVFCFLVLSATTIDFLRKQF